MNTLGHNHPWKDRNHAAKVYRREDHNERELKKYYLKTYGSLDKYYEKRKKKMIDKGLKEFDERRR